jgi:hypothetical protein
VYFRTKFLEWLDLQTHRVGIFGVAGVKLASQFPEFWDHRLVLVNDEILSGLYQDNHLRFTGGPSGFNMELDTPRIIGLRAKAQAGAPVWSSWPVGSVKIQYSGFSVGDFLAGRVNLSWNSGDLLGDLHFHHIAAHTLGSAPLDVASQFLLDGGGCHRHDGSGSRVGDQGVAATRLAGEEAIEYLGAIQHGDRMDLKGDLLGSGRWVRSLGATGRQDHHRECGDTN